MGVGTAIFEEALDNAVESAGPEANFALRAGCNLLHDAVAVLVTTPEGDEHMERLRRELGIGHCLLRAMIPFEETEII